MNRISIKLILFNIKNSQKITKNNFLFKSLLKVIFFNLKGHYCYLLASLTTDTACQDLG